MPDQRSSKSPRRLILSALALIVTSLLLWWLSVELGGAPLVTITCLAVWWRYAPVTGFWGKLAAVSLALLAWGATQPLT